MAGLLALGRLPPGDFAGRLPRELSGGQRQAVAVAKAVMWNSKLVMLDEPKRVPESHNQATAGLNAAPTTGRIIERIGPILGVAPKLPGDDHKFDEKLLASY